MFGPLSFEDPHFGSNEGINFPGMIYSQRTISIPKYFLPGQQNFLYIFQIFPIFSRAQCSSCSKSFSFLSSLPFKFSGRKNLAIFPSKNNIQKKYFPSVFKVVFLKAVFQFQTAKASQIPPDQKQTLGFHGGTPQRM